MEDTKKEQPEDGRRELQIKRGKIFTKIKEAKEIAAAKNGWESFDQYYQQADKLDVQAIMDEVIEVYSESLQKENEELREALREMYMSEYAGNSKTFEECVKRSNKDDPREQKINSPPKQNEMKEYPYVVKIITDDDGERVDDPVWHYIEDHADAQRTLCSGEVFGFGEGRATYKTKYGKITCERCIELIKKYKAIRL